MAKKRRYIEHKFVGHYCPQCLNLWDSSDPNCFAFESVLKGTVRKCPYDNRDLIQTSYIIKQLKT